MQYIADCMVTLNVHHQVKDICQLTCNYKARWFWSKSNFHIRQVHSTHLKNFTNFLRCMILLGNSAFQKKCIILFKITKSEWCIVFPFSTEISWLCHHLRCNTVSNTSRFSKGVNELFPPLSCLSPSPSAHGHPSLLRTTAQIHTYTIFGYFNREQ